MKPTPNQIWKTISPAGLRRFATAVFFLFAAIGPLTMLMDTAVTQASWARMIVTTLLSGLFAAAIVLTFTSPAKLVAVVAAYMLITFSIARVDPEFLKPKLPAVEITADAPIVFSDEQIADIEVKRTVFGITAVLGIALGYALFVTALGKANKRRFEIESEVQLAGAIHESLLPKSGATTAWCEINGKSQPAAHIGGDFFDIIRISDSKYLVVIADASGHGIGSGILAAMTKSGIMQELNHTQSPALLLRNVNETIFRVTKKNMFVTCAAALFDHEKNSATFVTAGHPPVIRYSPADGTIEFLRLNNLALGLSVDSSFTDKTIALQPGDQYWFLTDGVTEIMNENDEQFGMERLVGLIRQFNWPQPSNCETVLEEVKKYAGTAEIKDDITLMEVKIV